MASKNWTNPDTLAWFAELESNPHKFNLFAVLRRIEAVNDDKPRIGESLKISDDPVMLHQEPWLAFAPRTISKYKANYGTAKDHLYNLAIGLFGPQGALPTHITEYARDRKMHFNDPTFTQFIDVFHHRMISLFYRAYANSEPTIEMDRVKENRFDVFVGAISGMAGEELQENDDLKLWTCLHRSGLLAMGNRPAEGLRCLLQDFFRLPIKVNQFTGGWLTLRKEDQLRLGGDNHTMVLGYNTTIGEKVFDLQHRFTIVCGALSWQEFARMLPKNKPFEELRLLTRHFCGDEYDWDVQLWLKEEEVPPLRLGELGELGWSTWLGSREAGSGDADVLLASKGY